MPQLGSSGDKLNGLQKAMAINEGDSEQWQQQARVKEHETISGKQQDTRAGQDLAGKRTETGNCDASQNGRTSKLNCAIVRRTISKLNPKRCCQKTRNSLHGSKSKSVSPFDDLNYAENQNSITTLNLFKYASLSERFAVALGIMCMFYAASWQPISVFILAIMASLMGQYSKQTSFILQLNNQTGAARAGAPEQPLVGQALGGSGPFEGETSGKVRAPAVQSDYENFPLLKPLYSIVDPIFEFAMRAQTTSDRLDSRSAFQANFSTNSIDDEQIIRADVDDILQHESSIFLKKSFEINGSAFLLALTQLLAFFCGLTIITWAARKQASRLKILYFTSCLHQEVTWFEAVDSAGGSGSSLNALVDRYEDGIGMKLALLCYFVGHICLFALTAFYQMFELAAFCMPFVLIVGLIIAYLSDLQADSIGDHALFAKRSLQLAEEIIAAIRTVFAFNGQQKEITRYSVSLKPVYRKSLIKHLYTALNTSLSKFSIFACFSAYCFYAMRLFPPYDKQGPANKATVLAVMRGAEVSIVNILISIPFMEALQQSKGSIARIYAAIERRSKIDPSSGRGLRPASRNWLPSISFRQVSFSYTERHGPTNRRRSTLPFLNLPGSPGSGQQPLPLDSAEFGADDSSGQASGDYAAKQRRRSLIEGLTGDFEVELPSRRNSKASTMAGSGSTATIEINNEHIQRRLSSNQVINKSFNRQADVDKINRKILNRFNLEIKAGQSVALVGPSGSGKSTVLALVQRLYDITGGQILIGNHDLKNLNISWLRNQIGVVTQEARLFDMSIAENIKLGLCSQQLNSDESGDSCSSISSSSDSSDELSDFKIMQQVIGAAKEANAHDFISKLPSGYQTKVGSGGVQLSGGQKQRIAIARALIRKPKILLLDECTSALDTESEALVKNSLMMASKNRTTLTVAHRLDTIKHCDMIVVMSEGQVVECGTHEQLMRVQEVSASGAGTYKSMYEEQLESIASNESTLGEPRGKGAQFGLAEQASDEIGTCKGDRSGLDNVKFVQSTNDDDCLSRGASKWTEEAAGNRSSQLPEVRTVDEEADEDVDDFSSDISINPANIERPSAWQLWQFISMPKWSATAAAIVCLLSGLILPINLIAHSYLFSAFAYNDSEQLGDYLHVFGLIILSFSSLVFIISFLQIILPGYVGEKLSIRLRIKMLDSLLNKPMFYFDMDSNSAGALCDRFNSYIAHLQNIAGTRTATILESSSTLLAGAIFGFGQSLQLSLFCLSFALLVLLTTIVESKIVQRESSVLQKYDARLAHMIADALSNIKTIASLNKEQVFIARFRDIIRQREQGTGTRLVLVKTFLISVKFVMPAMSWSASMYYGCHLLVDGRIDLQTVFIVCPVVLFAVNDTFRALVFLPELLKARKSIKRLYRMNHEFSPKLLQTLTLGQQLEQQNALHAASMAAATGDKFEAQPATRSKLNLNHSNSNEQNTAASTKRKSMVNFAPETTTLEYDLNGAPMEGSQLVNRRISMAGNLPSYMGRKASRLNSLVPRSMARGRIDFKGVEFAYPNRPTALVLQDFSLSIEPGQSVALVGGSGSGKSTCVQIIEKFYDYHAGDILLDGRDLRLVESNWVRSQIGLVSQEPCLLSYTIGDNIRYGDNSRFVSMEEVVQAARTANIHDFIMSLPDQYDTQLSSSSYSCSQLSGGQRQRIAIARALIGNAPILVFDEATSALDSRNETVVQDALNKARRGRTNLTIAHRLATVRDADKIAVMKEGRVVELGRHEQLLQIENGQYRKLWEQQEGGGSRRAADLPAPL